jgi:hypothetical protein
MTRARRGVLAKYINEEGLAGICNWLIENVQLSPASKAEIHTAETKLMAQARRHAHRD